MKFYKAVSSESLVEHILAVEPGSDLLRPKGIVVKLASPEHTTTPESLADIIRIKNHFYGLIRQAVAVFKALGVETAYYIGNELRLGVENLELVVDVLKTVGLIDGLDHHRLRNAIATRQEEFGGNVVPLFSAQAS